jgi:hypothetical protein
MLEIGQLICLVANVSLGSVIYMWTISSNCFHTEVMSILIQPMTLGCFGVHWNAPFRKVSVAWILDILVLYGHLDIVLHWVVLAFSGVGLNPLHGCHAKQMGSQFNQDQSKYQNQTLYNPILTSRCFGNSWSCWLNPMPSSPLQGSWVVSPPYLPYWN